MNSLEHLSACIHSSRIVLIGGGNMARSLIGGLIADGCDPQNLCVADPEPAQRETLRGWFGVRAVEDNLEAASEASVLLLAVKPQIIREVCLQLAPVVQRQQPLVLSIAAGVREASLRQWLGDGLALVRAMPNTPALVKGGASALHANAHVQPAQKALAESILRAVGLTVWVDDESQLDAVTALSGSGPAYFFLVMEAMERAGCQLGLSPDIARLLTVQTAFGAAKMALESSEGPDSLRERVTSPGGTTERALGVLRNGDLEALFVQALTAAADRARELGDLMDTPKT